MTSVMLATADTDLGLAPTKKIAAARATAHANETRKPVTLRDPVTDKLLRTVKPAAKKAKATAKPKAKAAKPKAKAKPTAAKKPKGMVVKILAMASRKGGVSPAELNKLTNWSGAPWKWLFANPKKNGYCDRWNYKFKVAKLDGETRYCVAK